MERVPRFGSSFFGTNIYFAKDKRVKSRRQGKQNRLFLSFVVACAEIHAYLIKPTWRETRSAVWRDGFVVFLRQSFGSGRGAMPPQITRVQFVVACNIKTVPSFVTKLLQPSIPLSRHCCMQYLVITYVKYFFEKNKPSLFFFQRKKRKVKIILRSRIVESIFKICFLFIIEFQFSVLIKEAR